MEIHFVMALLHLNLLEFYLYCLYTPHRITGCVDMYACTFVPMFFVCMFCVCVFVSGACILCVCVWCMAILSVFWGSSMLAPFQARRDPFQRLFSACLCTGAAACYVSSAFAFDCTSSLQGGGGASRKAKHAGGHGSPIKGPIGKLHKKPWAPSKSS